MRKPWEPIPLEKKLLPVVGALKALNEGTANPGQQELALKWIVYAAAEYGEPAFHYDTQRGTDFALGRQFVGQQIRKLVNLPAERMEQMKTYVDRPSRDPDK